MVPRMVLNERVDRRGRWENPRFVSAEAVYELQSSTSFAM